MILAGVLLLFFVSAASGMGLDLRLMRNLRQKRVAAIAMPSLRGILDRSELRDFDNDNIVLRQRLAQLEKELHLLGPARAPAAAVYPPPPPSADGSTKGNRVEPHGEGHGACGDPRLLAREEAPAAADCHPTRVEITAEEILFLTGGGLEPVEQTSIAEAGEKDAALRPFET